MSSKQVTLTEETKPWRVQYDFNDDGEIINYTAFYKTVQYVDGEKLAEAPADNISYSHQDQMPQEVLDSLIVKQEKVDAEQVKAAKIKDVAAAKLEV